MILALCPACDRQYDVSTLEPGRSVRCFCSRVFAVPAHGPATVQAGACSNCRASVDADHESCPYCGAGLEDRFRRATTICPKCFSRMREGARHCVDCGMSIAPQTLQALPEGRDCPRCDGALGLRVMGALSVVECAACEGMWLTPEVFEQVRHQAVENWGLGGEAVSAPTTEKFEDVRYLPCLACDDFMNRRLFRHRGMGSGVIVDTCKEHGVWLDANELERITAFLQACGSTRAWEGEVAEKRPQLTVAIPVAEPSGVGFGGGLLTFLTEFFCSSV